MTTLAYPATSLISTSSSLIISSSSSVHIYNPSSSNTTTSPESGTSPIRLLAVSDDGKAVVTQSDDKSLKVWDVGADITLRNTRTVTKRGTHLSFAPDGSILFADRVGDVYVYPINPKAIDPSARPQLFVLASDPTLNPDADFLLGHVSIVTQYVLTPDNKFIITADRDEHIRVSRYPKSYVIERYLFGSEGFVSALHIPSTNPDILMSAGGEPHLTLWNWKTGSIVTTIHISSSIKPYRKVKADPRRVRKQKRKKGDPKVVPAAPAVSKAESEKGVEVEREAEEGSDEWYTAPEGWMMPSGSGICVRRIDSVVIQGKTIVLFFSLGAAAIHSFVLPTDPMTIVPKIETLPLSHPLIAFTTLPGDDSKLLLSLDTAWGMITKNVKGGNQKPKTTEEMKLTEDELSTYDSSLMIVQLSPDGSYTDVSSQSPHAEMIHSLSGSLQIQKGSITDIQSLNLYEDLQLLPRWPGLEEDDDLAGTSDEKVIPPTDSTLPVLPPSLAALTSGENTTEEKDRYTQEELEGMGLRALGKLKAKGADVGDVMRRKKRKGKGGEVVEPSSLSGAVDEEV